MDDSEILTQVISGNPMAKRKLIEKNYLVLKKIIIKYAGFEFHEDILQETWIKIFNNIHTFQHKSDIQTWMIRIAFNVANTHHRKETSSNTNHYDNIEDVLFNQNGSWKKPLNSWQSSSPEENYSRDQLQDILDQEIVKLPDSQKSVLTLHDIEGLNIKTICNILEISESNIRVLLHRARQQLLLRVDAYYKEKQC